jgi:hypothetical protein
MTKHNKSSNHPSKGRKLHKMHKVAPAAKINLTPQDNINKRLRLGMYQRTI